MEKLLANSLKHLMGQKPFSKITVSEIIRDCKINRKTFYYHFQDIYELLKWMFDEEAKFLLAPYAHPARQCFYCIGFPMKQKRPPESKLSEDHVFDFVAVSLLSQKLTF